nr:unnamed protein product [Callosobruchus analis]
MFTSRSSTLSLNGNERPNEESLKLAEVVDVLLNLNYEKSKAFLEHYDEILGVDTTLLEADVTEVNHFLKLEHQNLPKNKNFIISSIKFEVLKKIVKQENFPNLFKAIRLAASIPISSASCERSFSAMRRIKNWLRTSMLQERTSNSSLLYIGKSSTLSLNGNERPNEESLKLPEVVDVLLNLNYEKSKAFLEHYDEILGVDTTLLEADVTEVNHFLKLEHQNLPKNKNFIISSIKFEVLKKIVKQENFPNLFKAIRLAASIPISSASCERSFSAMRRIKNWLRTSMLQERISNSSLLYIGK